MIAHAARREVFRFGGEPEEDVHVGSLTDIQVVCQSFH